MTLAELLEAATPGPWYVFQQDSSCVYVSNPQSPFAVAETIGKEDARLIALAPDLARLALDMGEELRAWVQWSIESFGADEEVSPTASALLTRLDGIANKDETA